MKYMCSECLCMFSDVSIIPVIEWTHDYEKLLVLSQNAEIAPTLEILLTCSLANVLPFWWIVYPAIHAITTRWQKKVQLEKIELVV